MKRISLRGLCLASTAMALGLSMAAPTMAQTPPTGQDDTSAVELGDIVITARKFEENLQDVPVAVSALTSQDLERQSIDDLGDVASKVVGFSFESFSGPLTQPVVRGQTQLRLTSPSQNVATFLNGLYLPRGYMVDSTLIELERIEVVKGPQSAQFGRNAFAGAISMVSRTPSLEKIEAKAKGTVGSDSRRDISLYVSAPIVEDKIAIGFGFADSSFDGTWDNNHPLANAGGPTDGKLGGYDKRSYYARLIAKPIERLTFDVFYVKTERALEHNPTYTVGIQSAAIPGIGRISPFNTLNAVPQNGLAGITPVTTANPNPSCAPGLNRVPRTTSLGSFVLCEVPGTAQNRFWLGELAVQPTLAPGEARVQGLTVDPRGFGLNGPTEVFSAKAEFDVTDAVTVSYQYGRSEAAITARGSSLRDPSNPGIAFGLPFGGTLFDSSGTFSTFVANSHELKISYQDEGPIRAFVGVNYTKTFDIDSGGNEFGRPNTLDPVTPVFTRPVNGGPVSAAGFSGYLQRFDKVWGIYGFVSYEPMDALAITLEGRYSWEDQEAIDYYGGAPLRETINGVVSFPTVPTIRSRDANYFTPRLAVTYKVTPDNMVYATVARGVKSGGLNGSMAFAPQLEWQEEKNWTFEVGSKNTLFDNRLRFNFALFYTDWKALQTNAVRLNADGTSPTGFAIVPTIVGNLGEVSVWGGEVEAVLAVTDSLRLNAAASYNTSKYKDGSISQRFQLAFLCDDIICPTNGDISGNRVERTPAWDVTAGFDYNRDINDDASIYVRGDLQWQSKMYLEEMNLGWVSDRFLVNAAIGARWKWIEAQLWAKNLLDKEYVSNALALVGTGGARTTQYSPFLGEKRTIGLSVTVKY
jgi:iron complex outermembrane recepter protein